MYFSQRDKAQAKHGERGYEVLVVIINGLATSVGALLGIFLKKGVPETVSKAVFTSIGLCLAVMAIQGAIQTENILLLVLSLAVGVAAGTILSLEDKMQAVGAWVRKRLNNGGDSSFTEAFVTLSIMQVVSTMAILGPIQAALLGDNRLMYLKTSSYMNWPYTPSHRFWRRS